MRCRLISALLEDCRILTLGAAILPGNSLVEYELPKHALVSVSLPPKATMLAVDISSGRIRINLDNIPATTICIRKPAAR